MLAVIYRRNVTTPGPVLHAALRDGLGDDYADVIATLPSTPSQTGRPGGRAAHHPDPPPLCRQGEHHPLWPDTAPTWPTSGASATCPRDGKAPVLVQVPGGAWMIGMRRPQGYPLMSHMADLGWVCVSVGYRVSPMHTWPDHIVDVKRALAWVKEHIAEYGGDPDFVAITGGSAGGHLASLAALTPNDPAFQPGFEEADTSVAAAVPMYGRYDWYLDRRRGPTRVRRDPGEIRREEELHQEHRQVYVDASSDRPGAFRRSAVLRAARPRRLVDPCRKRRGTLCEEFREVAKRPVLYAELPHAQHGFDMYGSPRAHQYR